MVTSRARVLTTVHLCVTSLGGINSDGRPSQAHAPLGTEIPLTYILDLTFKVTVLLSFSTQSAWNSNVESLWRKGQTDTNADALVIVYRRTTSEEFDFQTWMEVDCSSDLNLALALVRDIINFIAVTSDVAWVVALCKSRLCSKAFCHGRHLGLA